MQIAEIILEIENDSVLSTEGERAGLILLGAMLLSFLLIRFSTRMMRNPKVTWWPGSIKTEGGLHVHHLVFGIVLMLFARLPRHGAAARQPVASSCPPAAFGIGAGLTLDEYALFLQLPTRWPWWTACRSPASAS